MQLERELSQRFWQQTLQEVYGKLEEPDGLEGLVKLRQGGPRPEDQRLAAEKAGNWSEAATLYEQALQHSTAQHSTAQHGRGNGAAEGALGGCGKLWLLTEYSRQGRLLARVVVVLPLHCQQQERQGENEGVCQSQSVQPEFWSHCDASSCPLYTLSCIMCSTLNLDAVSCCCIVPLCRRTVTA